MNGDNGKLLLYCFKSGCNFRDIAHAANLPASGAQVDSTARKEAKQKQAKYAAAMLAQARSLWDAAKPIAGTKAEAYLRRRGITAKLPDSLRFVPNIYHTSSSTYVCALVANVEPTGGIHRTFLTKQSHQVTQCPKMMLGPCSGGAVRLSDGCGPLVVCEGIETGLSLVQGLGEQSPRFWAVLSAIGVKALYLPVEACGLIIARDNDKNGAGQQAAFVLADRATALGWEVSIMDPGDGRDFNDVLMAG